MIKKILIATLFLYFAAEASVYVGHRLKGDECQGWKCAAVSCPDGYAVWIPEEQAFLPCDKFEQYVNIGNKSVLK